MDEDQVSLRIRKCKHLKCRFHGVYSSDNYLLVLPVNTFIIVNTPRSNSIGTHWVVLAKRYAYPILSYAEPLALPITTYKHIFSLLQMCRNMEMMMDMMENRRDTQSPLQSSD